MRRLLEELDALDPLERGRVFEHRVVPWILRESPVYRDQLAGVSVVMGLGVSRCHLHAGRWRVVRSIGMAA